MKKRRLKNFFASACLGLTLGFGTVGLVHAQTGCGSVTIAAMNWQSAELLAALDKFILEHGYGCNASIISSDTVPAFTSMIERGQPDIIPEGWVDLVPEVVGRGLAENKLVDIGASLSDGGQQGLFIPQYIADAHPDIKTIEDAFNHPEVFPSPDNPSKGALYNGPQGYGGAVVTAQLFKAYDGEGKNFDLIDTGSAAGLDGSIARAYERREPIFVFYWEPTSLLGRYDMVRLGGVAFDEAEWKRCTSVGTCPDPKPNIWPPDRVRTIVTAQFAAQAAEPVLDYLKTRSWGNKTVNNLLAWMSENQATGEEGARYFLSNNKEMWRGWVSDEAAEKIESAL